MVILAQYHAVESSLLHPWTLKLKNNDALKLKNGHANKFTGQVRT
jgi:hypothetical protein